ncbi:predicted protein [Pyrenophora tritici-repentis Pt-1C-BFP]|uniref:Uncharacterized protein n=1 Tax=Pyrenophora tritici-repentis (strain Pt-1C-BFP) TaxID=426418 RepID=B2WPS1_PYRTR|nr:uncharacterized protein PTRG_11981 [Pyrenophora tritici-repentis Pt-1C-BFP]EDU46137.1 predicted protein [Pyrenophora tritici-repentis Pt-1C-BFP]
MLAQPSSLRNLEPLFSAVRSCQQQPKHTVIIAPTHLHSLTSTWKFDLMKRKRFEWGISSLPRTPSQWLLVFERGLIGGASVAY